MKHLSHLLRLSVLAVLIAGMVLGANPVTIAHAGGTTITVDTLVDNVYQDTHCSLAEAIINADEDINPPTYPECEAGSGDDIIKFLDVPNPPATIKLTSALPPIIDPDGLTIDGQGKWEIDGQYQYRIFTVNHAPLTLQSITLKNGWDSYVGGGIYNDGGSVTVTKSYFQFNVAPYGGAINNFYGTLTVANSIFALNRADNTIYNNASGGAIFTRGVATLTNNTFSESRAVFGGDLWMGDGGQVRLANNIFANLQDGGHCYNAGVADLSGHHNLFQYAGGPDGTSVCNFTNNVNGNRINLLPLFEPGSLILSYNSPAIGAGDDAACEAAPVSNTSFNSVTRPQGLHCDMGAYEFPQAPTDGTQSYISVSSLDGWVLESSETSNLGGTKNNENTLLYIGDNLANKQYRAILSFDTSGLPDNAIITSVTLKFKYAGKSGTLPFSTHGKLLADVRDGAFKDNPVLQPGDFNDKGIFSNYKSAALSFTSSDKDASGWYSKSFNPTDVYLINLLGNTQIRLRFAKDDNNDFGADFLKIYSGETTDGPQLLINYSYYDR